MSSSRINFAFLRPEDVSKRPGQAHAEHHPTRALDQIWARLARREKPTVLDLGGASQTNIEFFSQFPVRLVIDDFFREYRALKEREPGEPPSKALEMLLEGMTETQFDIILGWDVLNYLTPPEAKNFLNALTNHARPGALLLLLVSAVTQVPATPRRYRILSPSTLSETTESKTSVNCARYSQRELLSLLPHWTLSRSLHLRNAMQEHLFTLKNPLLGAPA